MIKKLFIQLLFIGISGFAFSQEMSVTGFVKSEQNVGLPFVKVQVKGVTTGVTTDGTGFYRLKVSDAANSTLLFTYTGYEKQEVKLNGRSTLDIVLILSN
jgi:iron complex outermembrane receptor protein